MILSGEMIRDRLGDDIVIDPFDAKHLNPNSYNLTLHDELLTYEEVVLDMRKSNRVRRTTIPSSGLVLNPISKSGLMEKAFRANPGGRLARDMRTRPCSG